MPDRLIPPGWRIVLRASRISLYLGVGCAALAGLSWPPVKFVSAIGDVLAYWWAVLCVIGAVGALLGVLVDKYRVEWVAIWPAVGGTFAYASTTWSIVAAGSDEQLVPALIATTAALALTYRGLELSAHAAKLRAEHHQRQRRWWRA